MYEHALYIFTVVKNLNTTKCTPKQLHRKLAENSDVMATFDKVDQNNLWKMVSQQKLWRKTL